PDQHRGSGVLRDLRRCASPGPRLLFRRPKGLNPGRGHQREDGAAVLARREGIGKRFRMYGNDFFQEVIGIVETTKIGTLGEDPQSCAYLPLEQNYSDAMTLYLRTAGDRA